jgi:hypothetical protein
MMNMNGKKDIEQTIVTYLKVLCQNSCEEWGGGTREGPQTEWLVTRSKFVAAKSPRSVGLKT